MRAEHSSRIAVVGDLALDIYFDVREDAAPDEKMYASGSRRDLGGTGANAAAAIRPSEVTRVCMDSLERMRSGMLCYL